MVVAAAVDVVVEVVRLHQIVAYQIAAYIFEYEYEIFGRAYITRILTLALEPNSCVPAGSTRSSPYL